MPTAFERFRFSFFEDTDSARQGLDLAALRELTGEERLRAEDLLIQYLPDTRGVIGLGVLSSIRSEPMLKAIFEAEQAERRADPDHWYPFRLMDVARALWQIHHDPRWPAAIASVLSSATDPIQREMAAEALCGVDDPATVTALKAALDDSESLVRHHAGRGLLIIYRVTSETALPPVDPGNMLYLIMSNDPAKREGGKRDILAAIAGR